MIEWEKNVARFVATLVCWPALPPRRKTQCAVQHDCCIYKTDRLNPTSEPKCFVGYRDGIARQKRREGNVESDGVV